MSNLDKIQNSPSSIKNQIILKSTVWIQNPVKIFDQQEEPTQQNNTNFKTQHRQYIIERIKRRKQENKKKIQIYGQSSSDEEKSNLQIKKNNKIAQQQKQLQLQSQSSLMNLATVKKYSKVGQENDKQSYEYKHQKQKQKQKYLALNADAHKLSVDNNKVLVFLNEKKSSTQWIKIELNFNETSIKISHFQYVYYDITKLKIIFTDVGDKCFKLKINWKNQQCIFAASYSNHHAELPDSFYIFSRIVNQKIKIMGKKLSKIVAKPQGFPQTFIKNSFIYGKILKRSRIIGKWNEIFAVINKEGLFYSKKLNEKADLLIARTSISQLWTRFEFQGQFLIIKIFNNSSKIQLGIPVYNFMLSQGWIYYLYGLIFKNC